MDKVNILLIDDQPGKLVSYEAVLAGLDENLILARSGREALQWLLREEFALILLDVVMPEMDGFETAAMIRQRPKLAETPIIFLTAYSASDMDRLKGYELGAVDFVFAPVIPEILRAKVSVFVELFRKRRELAAANDQLRAEIAERQRMEQSLRSSEERFRMLVEGVKDYAIFMLDDGGHIASWNAGAQRIKGYRAEEILGQHFSQFYPEEVAQSGYPQLELDRAVEFGHWEDEGWRVRKDSSRFWANVVITAIRDEAGHLKGFTKITRDLTERKQAEEKLRQSERLATIGQMVAGLAHESRNSLQQIQASVEMLGRRVPAGPEVALVNEIQKAHDRLHQLLEEVRGYAAPLKLACEVRDLGQLWREAWGQLAAARDGRSVCFHEETQSMDLRCLVDPFPVERLFRNILENSLAACRDPVRIDVRTSAAQFNGRKAVRVLITDNGAGLNAEQRQRLFEPFYSTKTRGTGLGMAIARRVAEAHGGRIDVADHSGPGTAIEVFIPRGQP